MGILVTRDEVVIERAGFISPTTPHWESISDQADARLKKFGGALRHKLTMPMPHTPTRPTSHTRPNARGADGRLAGWAGVSSPTPAKPEATTCAP